MTSTLSTQPDTPDAPPPSRRGDQASTGLFRAFWRWHFYAAFLVAPVLLVLASTGLVYLLRFQLEPLLHADLMRVDPGATAQPDQRLPHQQQREAVAEAFPDAHIAAMTEPSAPDRSTDFTVTSAPAGTPAGEDDTVREVYVDPYTGRVLGSLDPDHTVSGIAKNLHKNLLAGTWGGYLMELGACWAIVMALTGYYLYWRGRAARARRRASARARVAAAAVLRRRHATTGLFVGLGLLALVVSGLPWTQLWGAKVQELVTARGTSMWSADPGAMSSSPTMDASMPHSHAVPWGQGKTPVPSSTPGDQGDQGGQQQPIDLDTALEVAADQGVRHPLTVALPADASGVYSVIGYAFNDPGDELTVHVDQYAGTPVASYGYDQYAGLAKVVSQGIALHEGRRFGTLNLVVTAAFCLAVIFMCLTGPLMWWRRRPRGSARLGAPRGRLPIRSTPLLAIGLVALGLVLPLFGASLLAVLLLDRLVLRRIPWLAGWFDVT